LECGYITIIPTTIDQFKNFVTIICAIFVVRIAISGID